SGRAARRPWRSPSPPASRAGPRRASWLRLRSWTVPADEVEDGGVGLVGTFRVIQVPSTLEEMELGTGDPLGEDVAVLHRHGSILRPVQDERRPTDLPQPFPDVE